MADNRTISQLEAEGYPWIGCECCKGTVWVPFRMLRERIPMLSAMTLDQRGARMKCDKCPGSFEGFRCPGPALSTIRFPYPLGLARIGVLRALNWHIERVFAAPRKHTHWGRRSASINRSADIKLNTRLSLRAPTE